MEKIDSGSVESETEQAESLDLFVESTIEILAAHYRVPIRMLTGQPMAEQMEPPRLLNEHCK